jgi:SRSO17 transposase
MEKAVIKEEFEAQLHKLTDCIADCFTGYKGLEHAEQYIKGLLSPIERKNSWQLAEVLGEKTPYTIQQFLYRGAWEADRVRDRLQTYVIDNLGEKDGVLIVDETGFLKKGDKSVGVIRQYSGTAGRIENCQVGVFITYASQKGFTMIDRQLYIPKEWIEDLPRCRLAMVPEQITFQTKPQMAADMLKKAEERHVPFLWATADSVYGEDHRIRRWLEQRQKGYVLAVSGKAYVWRGAKQSRISTIMKELSAEDWTTISAGEGSKGERYYDWKIMDISPECETGWSRCLLIRRSLTNPEEKRAYLCYFPTGTSMQKLVEIAGIRWTVEQSFEESKSEVGLDHYEVRSYQGWYKHITLSMCAHALLTVIKQSVKEDLSFQIALESPEADHMEGFKKGRHLQSCFPKQKSGS